MSSSPPSLDNLLFALCAETLSGEAVYVDVCRRVSDHIIISQIRASMKIDIYTA